MGVVHALDLVIDPRQRRNEMEVRPVTHLRGYHYANAGGGLLVAVALAGALRPEAETAVEAAPPLPRAFIDGSAPGWRALGGGDFVNVNCEPDTWSWEEGVARCTGRPVGVIRMREPLTNFELVAQWRHLRPAGNSGIFVWASPTSIAELEQGNGRLPHGIEVQALENAYKENYEKAQKRPADWFTTHGDVFPTGPARMKPFPPVSPNGQRSFPTKELARGVGEWNHYYVRCINGEVRLWVNGEEVSGGTECEPATGFLCLESEGSPVEFRNLRIRELP